MRRHLLIAVLATSWACGKTDDPANKDASSAPPPPETKAENAESPDPSPPKQGGLRTAAFDDAVGGAIPDGWTVTETNGTGTPATWGVVVVEDAPSPPRAFGVSATMNRGQTYNVALLAGEPTANVELQVMVKAGTGEQDQGGGVVFRVQGATDYYIARWNPLEGNVKLYVVAASHRSELAKAEVELDTSKWQSLRTVAEGPRMEIFVNDESVLVHSDETLAKPGGVGLWTKADAATLFDDFTATALE